MKSRFVFYLLPSLVKGIVNVLLVVPLTTFYLSPKDFGIAAILGAITNLAVPLSSPGATWSLSAYYFKVEGEERRQFLFSTIAVNVVFKIIIGILFAVAAPFVLPLVIKDYGQYQFYLWFFHLSLIGALVTSLWPSLSFMLILKRRASMHASVEISQIAINVLTIYFCLSVMHFKTSTLFIYPIISGVLSTVLAIVFMWKDLSVKFSRKWTAEICKIGQYNVPFNFLDMFSNSIDRIFIQRWFTLSELGIYAHAVSYKQFLVMGNKAFANVLSPDMLEVFSQNKEPIELRKMLLHWFGLLCIGGVFLALFSHDFVKLLTHDKFTAAAPLIAILFLLVFSHSYGLTYTQFLVVHKKNSFLLNSGIAAAIFAIAASALLIWKFNIMGGAISIVIGNLAMQIPRVVYARKLGSPSIGERAFCMSAAIVLAVYLANAFVPTGLVTRAVAFAAVSSFIFYQFELMDPLRNTLHRVKSSGFAGAFMKKT